MNSATQESAGAKKKTQFDMKIDLITLGDTAVGKTCLLQRFSENKFSNAHITTLGIDYKFKYLNIDGKNIKLLMWDTAGQERFRNMTQQYYKQADCAVFTYDCTNEDTFNSMRHWVRQFESQTKGGAELAKVLVGNKADLTDQRAIAPE